MSSSLHTSIFGNGENEDGALSGLFSASKDLPAKPNKVIPNRGSGLKRKKSEKRKTSHAIESETEVGATKPEGRDEGGGGSKKNRRGENAEDNGGGNERSAESARESSDNDGSSPSPEKKRHGEKAKKKEGEEECSADDESESSDYDGNPLYSAARSSVEKRKVTNRGADGNVSEAKRRFNEDETQQENETRAEAGDAEERTIFVGSLPPETTRKSLASMFRPCGTVVSARIRSVAVAGVKLPRESAGNQNLMRKVCANTNRLDGETPKKTTQGYVVFASADSLAEALKMNNRELRWEGSVLRLRVDSAKPSIDSTRSVFVGNLPYKADETTLRKHFVSGCDVGEDDIEGVRIIREPKTQQCKGFGYVLLRDKSMVPTALQMHESEYLRRPIRVMVCGKRFKGHRGKGKDTGAAGGKTRSFEGKRATPSDPKAGGAARRVIDKVKRQNLIPSQATTESAGAKKKERKRGAALASKKPGLRKAGISKRAAAEAKIGNRMKKIQKRVLKGMGKTKKQR